jgi:hypothetical protein
LIADTEQQRGRVWTAKHLDVIQLRLGNPPAIEIVCGTYAPQETPAVHIRTVTAGLSRGCVEVTVRPGTGR